MLGVQAPPCAPRSIQHTPRDGEMQQLMRGRPRGCPSRLRQGSGNGPEAAACRASRPREAWAAGTTHPGPSLGHSSGTSVSLGLLDPPLPAGRPRRGTEGLHDGLPCWWGSNPTRAPVQSAGEGPGCPGRLGRGPGDLPRPHSVVTPQPELPDIIICSSPNRSRPSPCHLCTPVLWVPPLVCEAPTSRGGTASEDQASRASGICGNCADVTNPVIGWAHGVSSAGLCSVPLLPAGGVQACPPGPRRQVGRCVALLHAIMTFRVMYTFSLSHGLPPPFFMRTGTRLMTEPQKKRNTMPL